MAEKPRFRRQTVFAKNLGFDFSFGYCNNTNLRAWMSCLLITSTTGVTFWLSFVCLFVSSITEKVMGGFLTFVEQVGYGQEKS